MPLIAPEGRRELSGLWWPLLEVVSRLALIRAAAVTSTPSSVACWALASKLALELVAKERVVPGLFQTASGLEARWSAVLGRGGESSLFPAASQSQNVTLTQGTKWEGAGQNPT